MSIEPVPPKSPYQALPARSFWKTGVAEQHPLALKDIYKPKFAITRADRIGTFGSCFAQHLAQFLTNRGYNVLDFERPPPGLDAVESRRFGYGLYSARYGNIYTARQLLQLLREADGSFSPACAVWSRAGRFYDALRPSVEPRGLPTAMAVETHRKAHLEHVRELIASIDIMVFTLGLTEAWVHRTSGTVYPTAPGTVAGDFDPDVFAFKNFTYDEMYRDFLAIRELLKRANPAVRFLLTVSPVPLTATASHDHVLVATIYSKSVLRAVAGRSAWNLRMSTTFHPTSSSPAPSHRPPSTKAIFARFAKRASISS